MSGNNALVDSTGHDAKHQKLRKQKECCGLPGVNYLDRSVSIILAGGSEACWVWPFAFDVGFLLCSDAARPV